MLFITRNYYQFLSFDRRNETQISEIIHAWFHNYNSRDHLRVISTGILHLRVPHVQKDRDQGEVLWSPTVLVLHSRPNFFTSPSTRHRTQRRRRRQSKRAARLGAEIRGRIAFVPRQKGDAPERTKSVIFSAEGLALQIPGPGSSKPDFSTRTPELQCRNQTNGRIVLRLTRAGCFRNRD